MNNRFDLAREQLNPILRPCPFCGGKAYVADFSGPFQEHGSYIKCGACGAQTKKFTYVKYRLKIAESQICATSPILAANAWNRRPDNTGTFACPDCGVSIPHSHLEEDKYGTIIVDIA
jgi:Lar family restriction alleviation protein